MPGQTNAAREDRIGRPLASLCGITNADLTGASGGNHTASITIP